jgi:hypothetical protein
MAVAGSTWCGAQFKIKPCSMLCALAVYEIQQGCYWCCKGGEFYENCIKPFEDILAQMGDACQLD